MEEKRILYFDDENWLAKPFAEYIEIKDKNLKITYVDCVKDLLQLYNEDWDLIILDIMISLYQFDEVRDQFSNKELNEMKDGMEFGTVMYDKIKSSPKHNNTPILFYSAKNAPKDENVEFIRKPALLNEIIEKIHHLTN